MLKATKIKRASQPLIPVKEYVLQAALMAAGNRPSKILKDKDGNIWLHFKYCHDVKRMIADYHLDILRIEPTTYLHFMDELNHPPYWIE